MGRTPGPPPHRAGAGGTEQPLASKVMDNDYPVDINEIIAVLDNAEVIVFRFLIVGQRLLLDPRTNERAGPLLRIVPPANSAEERFRSLRRLRPGFDPPQRITVVHWPKFVDTLESSGVWTAVARRIGAADVPAMAAAANDALCELRRLERREIQNALRGEGYQTVWERPA